MIKTRYLIILPTLAILTGGIFIFFKDAIASSNSVTTTVKISVCGNDIKENGEHCDGSALGGKSCTDLGYTGGTLNCSASCEFNTAICTTNAETTAIPLFTSTLGGTYTLSDDNNAAKIDLPEFFYTQDLRLQMFSYDKSVFESSKPAPSGKSFIGKTYDFVFINPDGGAVSALSQSVTLAFTYTAADVSGINESSLAPYRRESSDTSWQLISGATIDTTNKKVTFSTATFSSFALFGVPSSTPTPTPMPTPTQQSSGGGGGGGGSYFAAPETKVVFSGRAYPKSAVTILKDAQIAATTITDNNANFQVSVSGLSAGNYIFSVYSEDDKGNRSSLLTFPVSVTSGTSAQVGGIFIAPTITVDKSEVKRGENIAIFGQSAPKAEVTIAVNSDNDFFGKTVADANGSYLYNFDTAQVDAGQHFTKSKVALDGAISSFSKTISFIVGSKTVIAKPNQVLKGDLNGDKRVNLVDFSISAYWYKRANPPVSADLNGDGKVDLIDFSIMAFYWTG